MGEAGGAEVEVMGTQPVNTGTTLGVGNAVLASGAIGHVAVPLIARGKELEEAGISGGSGSGSRGGKGKRLSRGTVDGEVGERGSSRMERSGVVREAAREDSTGNRGGGSGGQVMEGRRGRRRGRGGGRGGRGGRHTRQGVESRRSGRGSRATGSLDVELRLGDSRLLLGGASHHVLNPPIATGEPCPLMSGHILISVPAPDVAIPFRLVTIDLLRERAPVEGLLLLRLEDAVVMPTPAVVKRADTRVAPFSDPGITSGVQLCLSAGHGRREKEGREAGRKEREEGREQGGERPDGREGGRRTGQGQHNQADREEGEKQGR